MKRLLAIAASVVLLLGVSTAVAAQDNKDEWYPNWFIGVQGGAQTTFTNYDFSKLITPQAALQVGHWFAPEFGVRLHFMGWEVKGGFPENFVTSSPATTYKLKALTGDMDFMFNMSNIIFPHRSSQAWNWILLAGWGGNYTWGYDEFKTTLGTVNGGKAADNVSYGPYHHQQVCGTKHGTFNGRLGTIVEYNVSKHVGINLELQANYKNDLFNLKTNDKVDWQCAALVGINFKFGTPKAKKHVAEAPAPAPQPAPKPEPKPLVEEKPEPAPVVKEEPLKETIYYRIRESDVNNDAVIGKVVDWCNKYSDKSITVSGYADKGTGNARVNKRYSQLRASKVAKALQAKGISASRISVASYGDTVQPYAENDDNRCVIIVGE